MTERHIFMTSTISKKKCKICGFTVDKLNPLDGEFLHTNARALIEQQHTEPAPPAAGESRRAPVDFNYSLLNWDFIHMMAQIVPYADKKYGRALNYTDSELKGDKAPLNHILAHYRDYITGRPHDFNDPRFHLAAIAYNAMMEFFYFNKRGGLPQGYSPLRSEVVEVVNFNDLRSESLDQPEDYLAE